MIQRVVNNRWFAFAGLLGVLSSGLAWYVWPELGWRPLVWAMPPLIARSLVHGNLLKHPLLDIPLSVFILTALVGIWAAYDPQSAWAKFWVILGSVLLFYTLVDQPKENLLLVAGLFVLLGIAITFSFVLSHDWRSSPADVGAIQKISLWWMAIRPSWPAINIHPNTAGGIFAIIAPISLSLVFFAYQARRAGFVVVSLLFLIAIGIGLVLSSSRGAWLALTVACVIWGVLRLSSKSARMKRIPSGAITAILFFSVTSALYLLALNNPGDLISYSNSLPGSTTGSSRLELARNTLHLISDFPYTGGGLAGFSGLYSHYILVIPFFFFSYSHNFYLDVALEQGILGFGALLIILVVTLWRLADHLHSGDQDSVVKVLSGAMLVGIVVMVVHGLADNPLYGEGGTPLLFVIPGFATAILENDRSRFSILSKHEVREGILKGYWKVTILASIGILFLGTMWLNREAMLASWYSNLAAVDMARVELSDYPSGEWNQSEKLDNLNIQEQAFRQVLQIHPENQTAHHRLGLIAMYRQEFEIASRHLEAALESSPGHRGVQKNLAYSYVWSDKVENALPLLSLLSETLSEMRVYRWWWDCKGRNDLANRAEQVVSLLEDSNLGW